MNETIRKYKQRILSYAKGKEPLAVQRATPGRLAGLVRGRSRKQLMRRPEPKKWSVAEILAHLAEAEIVVGWRLRMMLSQSGSPIQAFDQDSWATGGQYAKRDPKHSLALFRTLRDANLQLLNSVKGRQWNRYGMHAERGRESIADYARMMAGHDLNHIVQIERILKK